MKHSPRSLSKIYCAALAAITLFAAAPRAQAQPDPNNAPKAQNPDNRPVRPDRRGPMTPEQREAMIERYMKSQLQRAGVTDEAQQDAVLDYIGDETEARQDLQDESRTLSEALRNRNLSDAQVAGLLNTYMVAIEDDRARRTAAQKKLGETVDMLQTPRLEAMLTLMGLWGEAPNMGSNMMMNRGRTRDNRRDNGRDAPPKAQPNEKKAKDQA